MAAQQKPITPPVAIEQSDLEEFLESGSADFAFEMECFRTLAGIFREERIDRECAIEHGGTYVDPLKKINRQFDIRVSCVASNGLCGFKLAVECKNISPSSPLLVYCVPREKSETRFDQVRARYDVVNYGLYPIAGLSPYHRSKPVGKSCVQVSVDPRSLNGQTSERLFKATDEGIYDKWSQALASLETMLLDHLCSLNGGAPETRWAPIPVLVVPDDLLWSVEFDGVGRQSKPKRVERVQYYVGKEFSTFTTGIVAGHVEFVTLSGLINLARRLQEDAGDQCGWFKLPG